MKLRSQVKCSLDTAGEIVVEGGKGVPFPSNSFRSAVCADPCKILPNSTMVGETEKPAGHLATNLQRAVGFTGSLVLIWSLTLSFFPFPFNRKLTVISSTSPGLISHSVTFSS